MRSPLLLSLLLAFAFAVPAKGRQFFQTYGSVVQTAEYQILGSLSLEGDPSADQHAAGAICSLASSADPTRLGKYARTIDAPIGATSWR
ncbi:hypothetical protein [Bythopirellula polymerisocia]|uniref:Uncharacterized protein n=1 Tax=Bythopirellula polymerisocia TaxID=2528003 RepID=A0A5C6CG24_9BACT|nr:hypothetical protein [Bythopirellula polymerisocia]TWU23590.1 hypothetical protein Pla144_37650 [Bythopirellula polymerisocia]